MIKFYQKLLIGSLIIGGLSLTSCSDDNDLNYDSYPDLIEGAGDITGGTNVVIVDINKIQERLFSIGTQKPVELSIENSAEFPLLIELIRDSEGFQYLKCNGLKDASFQLAAPKVFDILVKAKDGSQSKKVKVAVRSSASSITNSDDLTYAASYIGRGVFPWNSYGAVGSSPVLDFEAFIPYIHAYYPQEGMAFVLSGDRREETMEKLSTKIGLSAKATINEEVGKTIMSGDVSVGYNSTSHAVKNFEYYLGYYGVRQASVAADTLVVAQLRDQVDENGSSSLCAFLDTVANATLNNKNQVINGSIPYNTYNNNDSTSIYALLDHFGPYVLMQGTFGGTYIYMYARKENAYNKSIEQDVTGSIKGQEGKDGVPTTWLQQYQAKNSDFVKGDLDVSHYTSEYDSVTNNFSLRYVRGGLGVIDVDAWEANLKDRANWTLVTYEDYGNNGNGGNLLPLYDFIVEPDRKDAVKRYFNSYIKDHCLPEVEQTLILADVQMVVVEGGHDEGFESYKIMRGPDNKKRLYYPMMAGPGFPRQDQREYACETAQHFFVDAVNTVNHYWYYSLGYHGETRGITDIIFDDKIYKDKPYEWFKRGDHDANHHISVDLHDNYVCIKPGAEDEPVENEIKAVALIIDENDTDKSNWYSRIMATSGGAEQHSPFSQNNFATYENYWSDGVVPASDECEFFYSGTATFQNRFRIAHNKTVLPVQGKSIRSTDLGGNIQHPKNWDE